MCMQVKVVRKRRRSLVRLLASCVPNFLWEYFLPVATKTSIVTEKLPAISQTSLQLPELSSSSYNSKCDAQTNLTSHCCCQCTQSNPKAESENVNSTIVALQTELEEIKKQVTKLLELQTNQEKSSDHESIRNPSLPQTPNIPPPPPPPPPLPSNITPSYTPLKIERKKKTLMPRNGFPCGKELLRDLKKVQLKKIEKSPGGGPIKKPKEVVSSPGDILDATVKKRLELFQKSPDSDAGTDDSSSFEFGSQRNTPEKFFRSLAT